MAWAVEADQEDQAAPVQRKPLIVHVVRQFLPNRGGLEDVVANLGRSLVKRGYAVRVVTCDSLFSNPSLELKPHEMIDEIEVVRIPWRGSSRYPLAPQVFKHIADADVVHVHGVDFFFDALAWGRLLHRRPLIVTTHGGFFHTRKFAFIKKIWFQTLTRASALAYQTVVCCSLSDKETFAKIAPKRVALIENGVDIGKFVGAAASRPQRRIVTIGRFSFNKRLDHLLDAMVLLKAQGQGWVLDIIGSDSDLSSEELQAEVLRRDLQDAVSLHGSISNESVREIIGKASIFASASSYEGFGLVAIEAMSAGLLPVLNANDAYSHLARRHKDIITVDFANSEKAAAALALAYRRLAEDGEVRRALIRDAKAYSWEGVTDQYVAAYAPLLKSYGRRAIG